MAIEPGLTPETHRVTSAPRLHWSLGQILAWLAGIALIGLFVYALNSSALSTQRVDSGQAPDFSLTTFQGQPFTLSALRGKVVVVNFWASWCLPCRDEAVALEQTYRKYKDQNVVFVGVDYLDQEPMNLNFIQEFDVTYPNGPDIQGRIYRSFRVQGVPETFVINPEGKVDSVFVGPTTAPKLEQALQPLLTRTQ